MPGLGSFGHDEHGHCSGCRFRNRCRTDFKQCNDSERLRAGYLAATTSPGAKHISRIFRNEEWGASAYGGI